MAAVAENDAALLAAENTEAAGETVQQGADAQDPLQAQAVGSSNTTSTLNIPEEALKQRVKIYVCNITPESSEWEDAGTGFLQIEPYEHSSRLSVFSEDNGEVIFQCSAACISHYNREEGNVVVLDIEGGQYAISFEQSVGCDDFIKLIETTSYHNVHGVMVDEVGGPNLDDQRYEMVEGEFESLPQYKLPAPELRNLATIHEIFNSVTQARLSSSAKGPLSRKHSAEQVEGIATQISEVEFIPKLLDIFDMCEDLDDYNSLYLLFEIFRCLFLMCDSTLFEILLDPANLIRVIGTLEYDINRKGKYRDFLKEKVKFKEVVDIKNKELLEKIHQTYQIQYIKDVILACIVDDVLFTKLNDNIQFNQSDILEHLQADDTFLNNLFEGLSAPDLSDEDFLDLLKLLVEFSKIIQEQTEERRKKAYQAILKHDVIKVLTAAMNRKPTSIRLHAGSVLMTLTRYDIIKVRDMVMSPTPLKTDMMHRMVEIFVNDSSKPSVTHVCDILRTLLCGLDVMKPPGFLTNFYHSEMPSLMVVLHRAQSQEDYLADTLNRERVLMVVDLIAELLPRHGHQIKNYVLTNSILAKMASLCKHRISLLIIAIVRVLDAVIPLKNAFYYRHISCKEVLAPIMEALKHNGKRYNLLNSTIIGFLESVRSSNAKEVVAYLALNHAEQLSSITYVPTCKGILLRYEQNQEYESTSQEAQTTQSLDSSYSSSRRRTDGSMDDTEENYFREEDSQHKTAADDKEVPAFGASGPPPKPKRRSLLDYDDDEDDDVFEKLRQSPAPKSPNKRIKTTLKLNVK